MVRFSTLINLRKYAFNNTRDSLHAAAVMYHSRPCNYAINKNKHAEVEALQGFLRNGIELKVVQAKKNF